MYFWVFHKLMYLKHFFKDMHTISLLCTLAVWVTKVLYAIQIQWQFRFAVLSCFWRVWPRLGHQMSLFEEQMRLVLNADFDCWLCNTNHTTTTTWTGGWNYRSWPYLIQHRSREIVYSPKKITFSSWLDTDIIFKRVLELVYSRLFDMDWQQTYKGFKFLCGMDEKYTLHIW
jgi:hypothetical protein